ncbi:MAG: hypothetical protein HC781_22505 [Leptolyngbyaceae cyanobacterium CSU_1_4]|nr:hypothetical protein [Microcoleus sp. SU_5_3]NJR41100.1 hypothetical protein [Leptolyngbyaceae cyanobacterium CSU_1_4]
MMAIERPGAQSPSIVFMTRGRSNAVRAIECHASDRILCGRSNTVWAIDS